MAITVVVLSIVLAAFLTTACFRSISSVDEVSAHLRIPPALNYFSAACQFAAVVGLLAGLYWRPLAIAAAAGVILLTIGAAALHVRVRDPINKMAPALLAFVLAAVILALHVLILAR